MCSASGRREPAEPAPLDPPLRPQGGRAFEPDRGEGEVKRNRVFCARAILEILEEPPRLVAGRPPGRSGERR